jgi:hypothetical protein
MFHVKPEFVSERNWLRWLPQSISFAVFQFWNTSAQVVVFHQPNFRRGKSGGRDFPGSRWNTDGIGIGLDRKASNQDSAARMTNAQRASDMTIENQQRQFFRGRIISRLRHSEKTGRSGPPRG